MEDNNYVLITGASSGIGKYISVQLSRQYKLILNGRNDDSLTEVINNCLNSESHLKWIYDLNNIKEIESSINNFVQTQNISIKAFIHCAGFLKMLPLKRISLDNLSETMNVNFNSAALLIKSLISRNVNSSNLKNVIFISSTASTMGAKAFNVYSASKGALDSLMRSLAVELAPKVRLNSVLPGGIKTKMTENIYEDDTMKERMVKNYPLGLGEPKDVFEMVEFLLSEKSKWITGQQFVVDGGRSINISE